MNVLIGYGNDLRGDDAAGRIVAQRVQDDAGVSVEVYSVHQLAPEFADVVAKADRAVFVDAYVASEGDAARVASVVGAAAVSLRGHFGSPAALLALAECLHGATPDAWLVTVPGVSFEYGARPSATTEAGIAEAVDIALGLLTPTSAPTDRDGERCMR